MGVDEDIGSGGGGSGCERSSTNIAARQVLLEKKAPVLPPAKEDVLYASADSSSSSTLLNEGKEQDENPSSEESAAAAPTHSNNYEKNTAPPPVLLPLKWPPQKDQLQQQHEGGAEQDLCLDYYEQHHRSYDDHRDTSDMLSSGQQQQDVKQPLPEHVMYMFGRKPGADESDAGGGSNGKVPVSMFASGVDSSSGAGSAGMCCTYADIMVAQQNSSAAEDFHPPPICVNNGGVNLYFRTQWPPNCFPVEAVVHTYSDRNNNEQYEELSRSSMRQRVGGKQRSTAPSCVHESSRSDINTAMCGLDDEMFQHGDEAHLIRCQPRCSIHDDLFFVNAAAAASSANEELLKIHEHLKRPYHGVFVKQEAKLDANGSGPAVAVATNNGSKRRQQDSITTDNNHVPTFVTSDPELLKVEKKRQRNRIAARKCRTRKLERIAELETKVKELNSQNKDLKQESLQLKVQIYQLRQILIDHSKNGCGLEKQEDYWRPIIEESQRSPE